MLGKDKLLHWIETYTHDCKMGINISALAQDKLGVANWEGRIRALEHLKESIDEGEFLEEDHP